MVFTDLRFPIERLDQRGQRARIAHLVHQAQDAQTVLQNPQDARCALVSASLVASQNSLIEAAVQIALRVGQRSALKDHFAGVRAQNSPHRIVEISRLALRIIVVGVACSQRRTALTAAIAYRWIAALPSHRNPLPRSPSADAQRFNTGFARYCLPESTRELSCTTRGLYAGCGQTVNESRGGRHRLTAPYCVREIHLRHRAGNVHRD